MNLMQKIVLKRQLTMFKPWIGVTVAKSDFRTVSEASGNLSQTPGQEAPVHGILTKIPMPTPGAETQNPMDLNPAP